MKFCKKMQRTIEIILKAHGKLEAFNSKADFQYEVTNPGYLPLHIEKCGNLISIAHYYEQNGDLVPDPLMVFTVKPDGWHALSLENNIGSCFESNSPKEIAELTSFAEMWATNLNEQGFVK